jgi:hypothetical protein
MSTAFPESYDEIAVLKHYGATDAEATRLEHEREQLPMDERHRLDVAARGHYGRTLEQIRARWREHGSSPADDSAGGGDSGDDTAGSAADSEPDRNRVDNPAGVPDGTMADVLNWVGADRKRARAAIAAEQQRDDTRSSLVGRLQRIANG